MTPPTMIATIGTSRPPRLRIRSTRYSTSLLRTVIAALSLRPQQMSGGAGRDRTGGLLVANQALSQLSYSPDFSMPRLALGQTAESSLLLCVVGLGRLELPTSPLSGVRSSHLSYRPGCFSLEHLG